MKPVTAGYRVALTYNLVHTGPSTLPTFAKPAQQQCALGSVLSNWLSAWNKMADDDQTEVWMPNHVIYPLEHEYTEVNLRLDHLKGQDRKRVSTLASLGREIGFTCYLCMVEKTIRGPVNEQDPTDVMYMCGTPSDVSDGFDDHHSLMDEDEVSYSLPKVVELDGTLLARELTT